MDSVHTPGGSYFAAFWSCFNFRFAVRSVKTGSGKTLAYLLPILAKLIPRSAVQAIIVVPTRELGMQVRLSLSLLGHCIPLRALSFELFKAALSL